MYYIFINSYYLFRIRKNSKLAIMIFVLYIVNTAKYNLRYLPTYLLIFAILLNKVLYLTQIPNALKFLNFNYFYHKKLNQF